MNRISQQHASVTEYYLAAALSSAHQLADSSGEVVLRTQKTIYPHVNGTERFLSSFYQTVKNPNYFGG